MREDIERDYWARSKRDAQHQDDVRNNLESIRRGVWIIAGFTFVGMLFVSMIFWQGVL
jgi:hypothetical protein